MAKKDKKLKENPLIKSSKENKKLKKIKVNNISADEDENDVKKFIIIVLVIALVVGVIYFFTEKFKKNPTDTQENETVAGQINYDKVVIGTLLNRPEGNYYVLIYSSEDDNAMKYSTMVSKYTQKSTEDAMIRLYYCDLANTLNKAYYNVNGDNKSNPKAKTIKELDLGDLTLIRVKDGKIVEYIEDYTTIQNKLK